MLSIEQVLVFALLFAVPQIAILTVASGVSFRLSRQRQSRGFFLIFLGVFIKLVVDGIWSLSYWLVIFPYITNTGLVPTTKLFELATWTSIVVTNSSLVTMLTLAVYGALTIAKERSVASATVQT